MTTARRSPRQQRSRQTVTWILEAAAQVFHERGYAATTTNKVAERAGVSIGSVYQYFPDKDALLAALAERHMAEAAAEVEALVQRHAHDPLGTLIRELIACVAGLHAARPGLHALLVAHALRYPRLQERLREIEHAAAAPIADRLRRSGLGGDPDLRALLFVQGVDAQIHGALLALPPGLTSEEIVEELVDLWTAALSK
ncbi:helix-turn-helix domain-containing protein [Glycomyces sp. NPDC046736]|uniref:TetR/AcrR family transcriptional regulator n=1 Tax=Glycomyces sp. NPDC046736 TaxID=3155615 RepID=UPI0034078094